MRQDAPTKTITYALHGLIVNVSCDEDRLAEGIGSVLDYFGLLRLNETAFPAAINLTFRGRASKPVLPSSSRRPIHHNGVDIYPTQRCIYLRDEDSIIQIRPSSNTASGVIRSPFWNSPGIVRIEAVNLVIHTLLFILRRQSFFALHAAGVAKGDEGLLLVAESDSGKSTQAMNLVKSGWKYLSDDSLLLRPSDGGVDAWALRSDFGLDEAAEGAHPEVRERRRPFLTDERKNRIDMAPLFPGQAVARCKPRLLLFPRIVDKDASRMAPISEPAALFRLVQQSVLMTADRPTAGIHIRLLKRLVEQTTSFELLAGRDLLRDPGLIARMVEPHFTT